MRKWALLLALACSPAAAFGLFGPNVDAVKDKLADPYSAKFENVTKVANGATCGTVNSKNDHGAYSGRKEFAIVDGRPFLEGSGDEQIIVYCIEGKDCKDDLCIKDVSARREAQQKNANYAEVIGEMRTAVAGVCAKHIMNYNEAKSAACGDEYYQCRQSSSLEQEFNCLNALVGKYK